MIIRKNEPTAANRRIPHVIVYDEDGALAAPTAIALSDVLYNPGDGQYVAAGGTWTNASKPLVVADFTFTTTHGTDTVNKVAHGLSTGDGPLTASNVGGALPTGYAAATNYWWIKTGDDTGKLAASLSDAIAGTAVAISDDGTGTHTLSDTASTRRLLAGQWAYTFTQAETNVTSKSIDVRVEKTGYRVTVQTADLEDPDDLAIHYAVMEAGAMAGARTFRERERISFSIACGKAPADLNASPYYFRDNPGGTDTKDRAAFTMVNGVRTPTNLDGT